jgi:hypothetical protein
MSRTCYTLAAALVLAFAPVPANAVPVDGTLDAAYGPAIVTQSVQTSLGGGQISGDSNLGELNFANGSELDLAYAYIAADTLHLFLAGNLALMLNNNQNGTVRHVLEIFLDTAPGGNNPVTGLGTGDPVNGLTFDAGFEPDYRLQFEGDNNGFNGPREWTARYQALTVPDPGPLIVLGVGSAGGPGTLVGGTNPYGILATIDNHNVGGVTAGCDVSSGAGVTTGIEWAIPLAALGNPADCIRMTVFTRSTTSISNQVLAPVPAGSCQLGSPSTVNFGNIAGDQFFSVCPTQTGISDDGDAQHGLGLELTAANPVRGDRLRVTFTLAEAGPAHLILVDVAGRVQRDVRADGAAGQSMVVDLSTGRRLAAGVYWARLTQGDRVATRAISVVR